MSDNLPSFVAVCKFCFHSNQNAVVEFNFRDETIYYICPECKKPNKMSMKPFNPTPYPKSRLSR